MQRLNCSADPLSLCAPQDYDTTTGAGKNRAETDQISNVFQGWRKEEGWLDDDVPPSLKPSPTPSGRFTSSLLGVPAAS